MGAGELKVSQQQGGCIAMSYRCHTGVIRLLQVWQDYDSGVLRQETSSMKRQAQLESLPGIRRAGSAGEPPRDTHGNLS